MNHPTPTPKPFNGFKYIAIPLHGLLSASVFAFGIFSDDEDKLNLPGKLRYQLYQHLPVPRLMVALMLRKKETMLS